MMVNGTVRNYVTRIFGQLDLRDAPRGLARPGSRSGSAVGTTEFAKVKCKPLVC